MTLDFGRVVTAMVTPFDDQLQIDWQQTEVLVNHLIEKQQTDSIIVCGTTGESPTLTDEEKLQLFAKVLQVAAGRCKVIAGTGSNDTAQSVALTKQAESLGADGILLVAPYYNRPDQEGLYQHFKTIAEATKLPVMLYNIPSRTGVHMSAETTIRLAEIPNIVATKESSGNLSDATNIIRGTREDFRVYSGDDPLTLPILSIGGYGIVSVASHVIGQDIQQMISAYLSGRTAEAAAIHRHLFPIFEGLFICPNPVTIKYALQYCGMPVGGVRLPLVPPSDEEKAIIEARFAEIKTQLT